MRNRTSLILLLLFSFINNTFSIIDYNENCKKIFEYTFALDYKKVDLLLEKEAKINPNNVVVDYIRTYSYFLQYATIGSSSSLNEFKKYRSISVDKIMGENNDNPYKYYFLADIYLIESISEAIQRNYLSAIYLFKKAYNTNIDNIKYFPDFMPNYKSRGAISVTIGSIPKAYNWGLSILGLYGDINQGFNDITKSLLSSQNNENENHLFVENVLIYTFLSDNFSIREDKNKLLREIFNNEEYNEKYSNNLIYLFSKASFYQHHKYNKEVIDALDIVKTKNKDVSNRFCYLNYLYGQSLLYKKDLKAEIYFNKYINTYPGNNYKAASHQKLAWSRLINGDLDSYQSEITIIKELDDGFYDSDKQAEIEANSDIVPNLYLLRSRLLFDGGYYTEAEEVIEKGKELNNYKSERNNIEYFYRLGRIYDENNKPIKAEKNYKLTILMSKDMKYYYAAKSALQLGYYYEKTGRTEDAQQMYELILELDFNEYENGITQKAKAGLTRLDK